MKRPKSVLFLAVAQLALAANALAGQRSTAPGAVVGRLRNDEVDYQDWKAVLAIGEPAIPELKKLLSDRGGTVRVRAAVLLYRLGEASALDSLAALLESKDEEARRKAAAGLLAFIGAPAGFDAAASEARRAAAVRRWKTWWKANREKAIKRTPMRTLYGVVVRADLRAQLVAVSLTAWHGAQKGMQLNVRRGEQFVCLLQIVMPGAGGSVARIVELSARTPPKPGDLFFATTR